MAAGGQGHAAPDHLRLLHHARKEHIIPRLGTLQLQKLTPASINALYAHLGEHGRVHGGGPLSASSVRRVHAVLHRACHDAVRWGRNSEPS